tara:strand:+ start:1309 stop:2472 length:1164 start_codon:yes stop_codon:yes gene_type:complete
MFTKIYKKIKGLYKKLNKIFIYKLPEKCDYIIYDEIRNYVFKESISPLRKIFILRNRGLYFYLIPSVLLKTFINICRKKIFFLILVDGFKNGFLRYLVDALHETIISELRPKIVITFIDNNPRFGRLSEKFKGIKFIAVQNGCRSRWDTKEPCIHNIYLTFTNQESIRLNKLGWLINKSKSIGSLNAARVFSSLKRKKVKRDLLIISTWRGDIEIDDHYKNHFKANKEMHIFLSKLIYKEKYNAAIILREQKGNKHWFVKEFGMNEEEFHKNIYGDQCKIIENQFTGENVYKEINDSNLSVAFLTSVILEGHIYGHNCLYLNFHDDNFYHDDFPKEIVISKKDKILIPLRMKEMINDSKNRNNEIYSISKARAKNTIYKFKKEINLD